MHVWLWLESTKCTGIHILLALDFYFIFQSGLRLKSILIVLDLPWWLFGAAMPMCESTTTGKNISYHHLCHMGCHARSGIKHKVIEHQPRRNMFDGVMSSTRSDASSSMSEHSSIISTHWWLLFTSRLVVWGTLNEVWTRKVFFLFFATLRLVSRG